MSFSQRLPCCNSYLYAKRTDESFVVTDSIKTYKISIIRNQTGRKDPKPMRYKPREKNKRLKIYSLAGYFPKQSSCYNTDMPHHSTKIRLDTKLFQT